MSGSVNALRAIRKKLARGNDKVVRKGQDKKSTSSLVPAVVEPNKRKTHSVSTPPEIPILGSPNHQLSPRKVSLSTDSPVHGRTPTSPLVMKSSSMANLRRDSSPGLGGVTPVGCALPTVNVMSYNEDSQPLDRQGIIDITVDVQNFLAAIARLKQVMEEADTTVENEDPSRSGGGESESSDIVLKHISDLVQVVHTCLGQHSGMQSTDIKDSAMSLMQSYQDCPHQSPSTCPNCSNAVDTLIDAFTSSVSEYLTGESVQLPGQQQRKGLEKSNLSTSMIKGFSKSHDNLAARYSSYIDLSQQFNEPIVDKIDQALSESDKGVEIAARYIKTRLKYHREVTSYLNKRAQIEARYHQQISKLGKNTQLALEELTTQEPCLPLVDVFRTSVDQDMKFASNCNTTYNFQVGSKLTEPLEQKSGECEKRKKELTQTWQKEQKKLADARTAMKNAKAKYMFLGQDLVRVKNLLAVDPYGKQADKRKKEATDYEARWQDAEMAYKNALAFCNDCQYQVHVAAQKSILCAYRRMVIDADMQLRSGLETYFTLQHNFFQTLTEPMVQNVEAVRDYDVGSEFIKYIDRNSHRREELEDYLFEEFDPEETDLESNGVLSDGNRPLPNSLSTDSAFLPGDTPGPSVSERPPSPNVMHAWEGNGHSLSAADRSASYSSVSPRTHAKKERPRSMAYLADPSESKTAEQRKLSDQAVGKEGTTSPSLSVDSDVPMSRNAIAHPFKKLRGPARCRECDTYVYFHGYECETCGLACHRKCLATLAIKCGSKRLARKMNTFGVDFQKHLKATKRYIPIIVTECIAEIDLRGLDTRGLYRVSSAKTKQEHLCQLFETGGDRVDLTGRPAHLIGSCLKLYFRQLPEPLLTFALYQDFLTFAREASYILPCKLDTLIGEKAESAVQLLERLKGLLQSLPYENYITLAKLLYHLNRVSDAEHVKNNFMPPSNLGIVFAPNLLRPRELVASLTLLADMTAQAKVVEIMISHVHEIIHVADEEILEAEDSEIVEVLVDDPVKSPSLEVDDALTAGSRTPNTTPPERRRENVSELSDVLDALQLVGRRNSQPSLVSTLRPPHPQLGDVRNSSASTSAPVFTNLPPSQVGAEKDTLAALGRLLRAPTHTPPIEKMLTPVQERQIETDSCSSDEDDDDRVILTSSSQKIDGIMMTRSESGLSNPSISWALFDGESEVSSQRDSVSILSEGDDTLSRNYRISGHSINGSHSENQDSKEDQEDLDNKDSSQGSDDSSAFAENNHSLFLPMVSPTSPPGSFGSFSSSTEGTPIRTMSESRGRHDVPSHLLDSIHRDSKTSNDSVVTLRSLVSSTRSSVSRNTTSSQGSFSEDFDSQDSSNKPNRYSRYERYERFSKAKSLEVPLGSRDPEVEINIEQSQGSTHSTQDSIGTLTDDAETESDDKGTNSVSKQQSTLYQNGEILNREGAKTKNQQSEHWEMLRDIQKQLDSGIDERGSPDTRSDKSNSLKRSSFPEAAGQHQSSPRQLSHPVVFNSRESGLADSPDSEFLLNDTHPLNGLHSPHDSHTLATHTVRSPTDHQDKKIEYSHDNQAVPRDYEVPRPRSQSEFVSARNRRAKSSEPDFGRPRKQSHVEILIPESGHHAKLIEQDFPLKNHLANSTDSLEDGDYLTDFNLSLSAPRSLESPLFSSIARNPVQRHVKASDNPLYELADRHPRSSSVEPPTLPPKSIVTLTPKHMPSYRASSETRSLATSTASPTQSTSVLTSGSSGSELSVHSRAGLSKSLSALASPSPTASPNSSMKKKWGKRLHKTFKPALRVLRITPNSTPTSRENSIRDIHLTSQTPESSPSPSDLDVDRVRMISPESVAKFPSQKKIMRRSRSFDDILDVSKCTPDNEVGVKMGLINVIPEQKIKSKKSKLFSSFQGNKSKGKNRHVEESPVVLMNVRKKKVSVDVLPTAGESNAKSPKTRKRSRIPHFV